MPLRGITTPLPRPLLLPPPPRAPLGHVAYDRFRSAAGMQYVTRDCPRDASRKLAKIRKSSILN